MGSAKIASDDIGLSVCPVNFPFLFQFPVHHQMLSSRTPPTAGSTTTAPTTPPTTSLAQAVSAGIRTAGYATGTITRAATSLSEGPNTSRSTVSSVSNVSNVSRPAVERCQHDQPSAFIRLLMLLFGNRHYFRWYYASLECESPLHFGC